MPTQSPTKRRTAREVIDAAIRENRRWETLCFWLVAAFAVGGLLLTGAAVFLTDSTFAVAGVATGALFWPALAYAFSIRKTNMAIRLLELPLSNAKTSQEAAEAIRDAFASIYPREGKRDKKVTGGNENVAT